MINRLVSKRVLIFGGTGSLGRAILKRWSQQNQLGIFSRDEAKHWTIKNELLKSDKTKFFVGDIRDINRVEEVILEFNPEIVLIAAALKQVDTCEVAPDESMKTNIHGVSNILTICQNHSRSLSDLNCVLLVSTDKACAPTNVYGFSKALAERLMVGRSRTSTGVKYLGVRYGNVLDSRGSIVPLFRYQAQFGESFTLTDKRMTRFLMTLDESIDLIEGAIINGKNGEIWIPKLRSMKIIDLAELFSTNYGKPIHEIGIRPGEKLHEDLISETESLRATKSDQGIILKPEGSELPENYDLWSYSSNSSVLNKQQLSDFLVQKQVFDKPIEDFVGRNIEEIRTKNQFLGNLT